MFQTSFHRPAPAMGVLARALLAALVAAASTSASAQDTASDGTRDAGSSAEATQLDTVMVKGQRLSLDLQQDAAVGALGTSRLLDTPFSVSLIEEPEIARRQATTLGQIFINDPSVFAAEPPATTNWWGTQIRGIGVRNFYVDGVPMLMEWGGEFPLEAVQSVQALKGLGGFMYGFGAPGGIVSYQTKRPTDTPLLATTVGYRNDSVFSAQVDAGGRADGADSFGYRLNAGIERGDAYNGAGIDRKTIALAVEQPIVEGLTWHAELVHERNTLEHEPLYFYWDAYQGTRLPRPTSDYDKIRVDGAYYETALLHATTGLNWRIDERWSAALSLGGSRRRHTSHKMFANLLNEAGDYAGFAYDFGAVLRNSVVQLLVNGRVDTGPVTHALVFGASVQRSWDQWSKAFYWSNDFDGNLYRPQSFRPTRRPDYSLAPVSADLRQKAVFVSDTLQFGDHWRAILGARHVDYQQRDLDGDASVDSGYRTSVTTPTVALIYKPVDDVSLYASYVEALEPGSRVGTDALPAYANAGSVLAPTVSKQYELGAKLQSGRFALTTAAFRIERGAQIDAYRDGLRYLTQDGLTLYRGLEVIGSVGVTEDLEVGVGGLWMDPRLEDLSPDNAALRGNRPAGAARRQLLANATWRVPGVRGLSLHGNVRYSGDAYYEDQNRVLIPGHTVAAAGFQYATTLGGYDALLTGNINNLFDRTYWNQHTLGEARNAALSLRIDWR